MLLDVTNGAVYALNPSASAVWVLMDGRSSTTDIVSDLSDIVGVPADVLAADVELALADFAWQGLLAPESTTDPGISPLYPPPDP